MTNAPRPPEECCRTCRFWITVAGATHARRGWCGHAPRHVRRLRPDGSSEVYELKDEVGPADSCDHWTDAKSPPAAP